ncbi:tetratricopeptide repeat protein [bacterium]|nr:tetratricopeptide repeat protein [bacterium]
MYFAVGKSHFENKNYKQAVKYFKTAVLIKPNNLDYRYYYVKTLSVLPPTYDVQKSMYSMAKSKKEDGAQILANEKIIEWKSLIHQNIGYNYIEQAPVDASVIRWNKNSFPLKIYIDTGSFSKLPDYYRSAVARAFKQWGDSIDFVSFITAKNKSEAQIIISFDKMPSNVCNSNVCQFVVGYTTPKTSGKILKNMTIIIYDKTPFGDFFSDKEIYNTVLHELGHALGIMGHSYSTNDLMAAQSQLQGNLHSKYRSDFQYLTGSDVNTMQLLYLLEPNITNKVEHNRKDLIYTPIILGTPKEIALKKITEAQIYIKNSPELASGYINLAGAYMELKEHKKALNALQNASDRATSDNEKLIIYHNFAYVYYELKKYDIALRYAKLAKNISPSQEILELIALLEKEINSK